MRFGRFAAFDIPLLLCLPPIWISTGTPDSRVTIPESCQPPRVDLTSRLVLFRNTGTSYTKLTRALCVRSKPLGPTSYFHPRYGLEVCDKSAPPGPRESAAESIAREYV